MYPIIDEKRLDELAKLTYIEDLTDSNWDEFYELLRLARLGLWAEKHGLPAVKKVNDTWDTSDFTRIVPKWHEGELARNDSLAASAVHQCVMAYEALAALPNVNP